MSNAALYSQDGKKIREITLEPKLFDVPVRPVVVQQVVKAQLANRRQPIAHAKDRSEVRGGGKKPWRQKGTGRARHGSIRSPLWKGGGVTFGPSNERNFSMKVNKKARRTALLMSLSDKAARKRIIVLDKLSLPKIKTSALQAILNKLPIKRTALLVIPKNDSVIIKSARNIPSVYLISADSLNVYDVLRHDYLVVLEQSLAVMIKMYTA
ncbi:MAG: 50S ribosomal protein L4 [Patescibacteria group bacterium]|nr:50S ribosomal protein L4 [Patescibacteria group bacterium]MDD5715374.1 50S ribosomal protein L4 [Patescibacteria group bacterium]